ncbi:unnamed protein product [Dicrocoelium dendriticum]|nr:unnamed protein product [Dicrocoelium dendriticum]
MLVEGENEEDLRQLWERYKQAEILTQNIKCIPWVRGELALEPNHELVFEVARCPEKVRHNQVRVPHAKNIIFRP